ncbi:EAL domain-containing protein [Edaphovirga cremea]|uniref:EAL domain-containing protein n=1 Tax=Edaphovirga cremea TaxID=2267246 RepID=UPI0039895277
MEIQLDTAFLSSFWCQPVYSRIGKLLAVELANRFNSEDGKLTMPIELVTKSLDLQQLTQMLDEQINYATTQQAWFLEHGILLNIFVDQSLAQLIISDVILRNKLAALSFIRLEVSESFPDISLGKRNPVLSELSKHFRLWLVNFGSGNAHLAPLFDHLFEYVKTDKNFFWQLVAGENYKIILPSLLRNINRFCQGVVIDGIDTKDYFSALNDQPFAGVQGMLWPGVDENALNCLLTSPLPFAREL